ncbi:hypothetical protein M441DRAFT_269109 [Trichoderma asperellum CBS 433.97]|uniref:Uncharacterized protein n=1 Tax=Trichoderma asperellum (strain ATCC 204424 / CBS 433.97 / NBRC 101777) TaxID=1042311 RepID=A0A2T3YW26_TRIA4|nr:hypothetical protein M441DRAFT_269109 [Trichoderma asperellum CBS 433.97]PTB36769.1 hypothetical protein M441DRAFT_269109 [Trichoderma asperellum CBS 433.97]
MQCYLLAGSDWLLNRDMRRGRDWLQHRLAAGADCPSSHFCVVTEWSTFAGPCTRTQLAARHEARARLLGRAADWHDAELAERSLSHSQPGPCVEMSVFVLRGLVEVMMLFCSGHQAAGGRMNH